MKTLRFALTPVIALALLTACADNFDPDDPRLDGARLVIVGSPAITLRYDETAELRVRYEDADGMAIASAPIDYEIVGEPGGSRLAALQTTTGGGGEAAVVLTAGGDNADFVVNVTPPQGDSVQFSVSVSDTDAGSIVVNMSYNGTRTFNRFDAFIFDVASCMELNPNNLPTAIRSAPSVTDIMAMPAFAGVQVGANYVVAVSARTDAGVAGFGCADGVVVRAREETTVPIQIEDTTIGPDFTGVWDLDNRFDFAEGLPPTVRNAIDILDELTDDNGPDTEPFCYRPLDGSDPSYGRDPGAFVVDLVARQTCRWECMPSETFDDCSQLNHRTGDLAHLCNVGLSASMVTESRFTGGCLAWDTAAEPAAEFINDQLERFVPNWVFEWAMFAGDLSRAINSARIASVLEINRPAAGTEFDLPMRHQLTSMTVILHDPLNGGMERMFTFNLRDAGITDTEVTDAVSVDGNTLMIPEHQFTISFGRLVQYIYTELFLRTILGYMSSEEMLQDYIDCSTVGMNLASSVGILSATQYENACNSGIGALGRVLDTQIAGIIDADAVFNITGTATAMDIDESTMRVNTLANGMWTGYWGETDMSMGMMMMSNLTGTFTGTRRTE